MSTKAAKSKPATPERKFAQMTIPEKGVFLVKVVAMLVTFGFAFPNILID